MTGRTAAPPDHEQRNGDESEVIDFDAARRAALSHSDDGNGQRLVLDHGNDLRYVPGAGWHEWDDTRWAPDADGAVMRRAKDTVRSLMVEAAEIKDADKQKSLLSFALRSQQAPRLKAMIELAESEQPVIAHGDKLDTDPDLLNVANGTIDLRNGRLRDHDREDLITKLAPVAFEPDAPCPTWHRYLAEVFGGDADLTAYVQRAVGYTLTGHTSEQCLFILQGEGKNGKTTAAELIHDLLGDYATVIDPALLMTATRPTSPGAPRPDLVRLRGARYVPAVEVEQGAQLAEVLIKQLTGGSTITARELHQRGGIEFRPAFKLWLDANHLPQVRGTDYAIWRRLRVIPYRHRIERGDTALPAKLRAEAPGILAWAVQGAVAWFEHGLGEPIAVERATADYRAGQDTLASFLEARCELADDALAPAGLLYHAYKNFCADGDLAHLTIQAFKAGLEERGVTHRKTKKGAFYEGVSL
jgi:putative DNA primase/helicase